MDMRHQQQSPTRPTVCKAGDTDGDGIPTNKEFKMVWACFTCDIINQLGHEYGPHKLVTLQRMKEATGLDKQKISA